MWLDNVAGIFLAWYIFIALVCSIGCVQLLRHYSSPPERPISSSLPEDDVPQVTVIRPCKGLEPYLYECLASTLQQDYPISKLKVHFCVSSRDDPAYQVIRELLSSWVDGGRPARAVAVFVEDEDPLLQDDGQEKGMLGPNPKIRNMSRAYREAEGDIVWILDCNVWVGRGACGRMVDKLCGFERNGPGRAYKFVHHLPICVDVDVDTDDTAEQQPLFENGSSLEGESGPEPPTSKSMTQLLATGGGRLEELFLSSAHAKFYTAINTVAVAPCILGKSNMFRRSHLDYLTSPHTPHPTTETVSTSSLVGIDHFSHNICEDHLIGDLLWRGSLPHEPNIGKHALVLGDLAIQPISRMSVGAYIARRVRWLRVRKFTVTLATLVEPGTESLLCSAYGAFAVTTLPWFSEHLRMPQTWLVFMVCWLCSIASWAGVDWLVYLLLHSGKTVETRGLNEAYIPLFARPLRRLSRRPFAEWLAAWLAREGLALPIWLWAFWGGVTVVWRDRKFWVGLDMKVHEIAGEDEITAAGNGHMGNGGVGKSRRD